MKIDQSIWRWIYLIEKFGVFFEKENSFLFTKLGKIIRELIRLLLWDHLKCDSIDYSIITSFQLKYGFFFQTVWTNINGTIDLNVLINDLTDIFHWLKRITPSCRMWKIWQIQNSSQRIELSSFLFFAHVQQNHSMKIREERFSLNHRSFMLIERSLISSRRKKKRFPTLEENKMTKLIKKNFSFSPQRFEESSERNCNNHFDWDLKCSFGWNDYSFEDRILNEISFSSVCFALL